MASLISVNSSSAISSLPMKATMIAYPLCSVMMVNAVVDCPSGSSLGYRCHSRPEPVSVSTAWAVKVYSSSAQSGSDSSASIIVRSWQFVVICSTACWWVATCAAASGSPPVSSVMPATSTLPAPWKFSVPKSTRVIASEDASMGDQSSSAMGPAQDCGLMVSSVSARSSAFSLTVAISDSEAVCTWSKPSSMAIAVAPPAARWSARASVARRISTWFCSPASSGFSSSEEQPVSTSVAADSTARAVVNLPGVMGGWLLVSCRHAGIVFVEFVKVGVTVFVDAVVSAFGMLHIVLAPAEQHDQCHPHGREFSGAPHDQAAHLLVFDGG